MRRVYQTPQTRRDCPDLKSGPCPHVGCVYNTYLEVDHKGRLRIIHPDLPPTAPERAEWSCALALAEQGPQDCGKIGEILNLSRERVRQIEVRALSKCRVLIEELMEIEGDEYADSEDEAGWRGHSR